MAINYLHDDLFSGAVQDKVAVPAIMQAGGAYTRGTVLAFVSQANGIATVTPVASGAAGTLSVPHAVLADPIVDATTEAVPCSIYKTGEFNPNALKFQGSDTLNTFFLPMSDRGINIRNVIEGGTE